MTSSCLSPMRSRRPFGSVPYLSTLVVPHTGKSQAEIHLFQGGFQLKVQLLAAHTSKSGKGRTSEKQQGSASATPPALAQSTVRGWPTERPCPILPLRGTGAPQSGSRRIHGWRGGSSLPTADPENCQFTITQQCRRATESRCSSRESRQLTVEVGQFAAGRSMFRAVSFRVCFVIRL
jgi:hypothetical protein